jgi:methionyl aminopeptidase
MKKKITAILNTAKIGRNQPCPCGSGLKYKHCCINKKPEIDIKQEYKQRFNILIKEPGQIEGIKKCGALLLDILSKVEKIIKPGLITEEINTLVHNETIRAGALPAPLRYKGFPKSVCVSVNDEVCHGIPGNRVLKDGDIVNVDITPILNGYYADASKTFFVGTPDEKAKKVVQIASECLKRGIKAVGPGIALGNIGRIIEGYANAENCSIVREYVGHGVGLSFHEQPQVLHFVSPGQTLKLVPGMVFTIEPMVNLGKRDVRVLDDRWTAITKDGSLSAQFEQTVLVTENGCESLTPYTI